jgi:hypothetical protein
MSSLINLLPPYEKTSDVFNEILRVEQNEFDKSRIDISDIEKQIFIDTATWGLEVYEKELGIKADINKPNEERRSVIKSKWRGTGKVDKDLIKRVVDAYTNGEVEVGFDGNIIVTFVGILGTPPNIEDAKNAVRDIAPAHLQIIYKYMYLLIQDIHEAMTLEQLESTTLDKFAF